MNERSSEDWLNSLEQRKMQELIFHDTWRAKDLENTDSSEKGQKSEWDNQKYYSTNSDSLNYIKNWINDNANGKVFLDYACGNGGNAIRAAKAGALASIGIDLSMDSLKNAASIAENESVGDRTYFIQTDCENTELPANSIDVMICSGMLHHLNLNIAFPEMRRILKPGGKCLVVEALKYNPIIKLYRKITPQLRTEYESRHILGLKEVELAKRYFDVEHLKYWHLFSVLAVLFRKHGRFNQVLRTLNNIDDVVLRYRPLCYLAWQFTFELHKPRA